MCRVIAWAVITDQDKNASNIIPYICRRLKANIPNGMAHTIDEQPHTVYSAWFSSQIMTRDEMRQAVFEYIDIDYNRKRRHSAIDYVSPFNFE